MSKNSRLIQEAKELEERWENLVIIKDSNQDIFKRISIPLYRRIYPQAILFGEDKKPEAKEKFINQVTIE